MTLVPHTTTEEEAEEYEVIPVYDPSAVKEHEGMGFCWDETCPDREDQDLIGNLNQAVQDGEVTVEEADLIYHGHTL